MKKIIIVCFLLFCSLTSLFSGDSATFVNLGFSSDCRYFMFAQHGYIPATGTAYSEMFIVDVQNNNFAQGGVVKGEYSAGMEPGQSSQGALFSLLEKNFSLKNKFGIDHLKNGRLLYIQVTGTPGEKEEVDGSDTLPEGVLEFRDFVTGNVLRMELVQSVQGSGDAVKSSFYINLDITSYNGLKQTYTIGHPNFMRDKITEYQINRVLIGPDNKSLIIIIAKKDTASNIRYMVETVRLK